MQFSWFVWLLSVFFLFMIFMNFIIAVIGDSFSKVLDFKIAYDYLQRAIMIYELEAHFSATQLDNPIYFPQILVVRTKRQHNDVVKNNLQSFTKSMKSFIKQQLDLANEYISNKIKEQKVEVTNSLRQLETNVQTIPKELDKILQEIRSIAKD